ncbi:class I SAM-dependent methyltransferase [Gaetbulibacter aestuarii]|uniref:Class I SAM-dependent methyltransferase n=1 Tax=Gaetbulibacter aestuarii TaxID=1502358 RepID=A0ABW7MYH2_9FLAO
MSANTKPFLVRLVRYVIKNPRYSLERLSIIVGQKLRGLETYKNVRQADLNIPQSAEPVLYESSGNSFLVKTLKNLNITSNDSIIDFGCGKGGALIKMANFPFKKIVGVEYSEFLYKIAQKNIKKLKLHHIQLFQGDAAAFKDLDDINYVYLFNPFGLATLHPVLENIKKSLKNNPRDLTLIYKNAVHHQAVINSGLFKKINQFKGENADFFIYKTIPKS